MPRIIMPLLAGLLLLVGASPALAQICSDGEVLIVATQASDLPEERVGKPLRKLSVNYGFNGTNGKTYFNRLVASDAFARGGPFYGFKPVEAMAPLSEYADMILSRGVFDFTYYDAAQLLRCPSAKKMKADTWRQYCEMKTYDPRFDRFRPSIYVLSDGRVRPFDMNRLPINPASCSDPARRPDGPPSGWFPIDSEQQGQSMIAYWSQKMLPGEEASLFYTGTKTGDGNFGGQSWPNNSNLVVLAMALTSGSEEIIGFDGIQLRNRISLRDLGPLYTPATGTRNSTRADEGYCGATALGAMPDGAPAKCHHSCFVSRADMEAQRNAVSCSTGGAHWIMIVIGGYLQEKRALLSWEADAPRIRKALDKEAADRARRGQLSLTEQVDSANQLAIKVKWKGSNQVTLPIDEMFRVSFWDPQR